MARAILRTCYERAARVCPPLSPFPHTGGWIERESQFVAIAAGYRCRIDAAARRVLEYYWRRRRRWDPGRRGRRGALRVRIIDRGAHFPPKCREVRGGPGRRRHLGRGPWH